jgi:hypothetical protein
MSYDTTKHKTDKIKCTKASISEILTFNYVVNFYLIYS